MHDDRYIGVLMAGVLVDQTGQVKLQGIRKSEVGCHVRVWSWIVFCTQVNRLI